MEEAPVVDCPPTPEILPLSVTPPRPEVVYSSSSEEADETGDGRRSPPPKCAICLGKCRQPAFTDSCRHQFCFRCLFEWSKVKPECPLCKQRFASIVYYKSIDCFEQHKIPVPTVNERTVRNRDTYHELSLFLSNTPRFTYGIPNMTLRLQSNNERLQDLLQHSSSEVDRFIREFGNRPVPTRQDQLRWRQFIYTNRLYARPLPDMNGRFREISAAFYRGNPAQMHRVLSWMHRDLLVLDASVDVRAPNMNVLEDLLQTHDMDSREFLLRILRHMPLETGEHFQHECTNFARSPFDMIGYDRCVQYNPRYVQQQLQPQQHRVGRTGSDLEVVISSSEEENDDIVYLPEPPPTTSSSNDSTSGVAAGAAGAAGSATSGEGTGTNRTERTAEVHIEFRSLVDSAGNEELLPVVVSASQSQQQQQQQGVNVLPRVPLTSTASSSTVPTENILLSSSDSDDCQFVLAQKPPHLRTPDHVVDLESASDSDVVFVAEEPLHDAPLTRAKRQEQASLLKKETAAAAAAAAAAASSQDYNNGASTSSGYCGASAAGGSGASGSALRGKYYVRPRMSRYSGGIGVKSIYEASDSDDSEADVLFNLPPGRGGVSTHTETDTDDNDPDYGQRKRRRPGKKNTPPKGTAKRASRKRRKSSSSSSSSTSSSASSSSSSRCHRSSSSRSSSSSSEREHKSTRTRTCSSGSSSSSNGSSSTSSSRSSSSSSSSHATTSAYHKNVIVEIECGRPARRNANQQRPKPSQADSKGRTKRKRSRKSNEKEPKRSAKERNASLAISQTKSKSRSAKSKRKGTAAHGPEEAGSKRSATKAKAKAGGRSTRRRGRGKKRAAPASDHEQTRSTTPLLEENASSGAHYVIASRPSESPTIDVTTVDGAECGKRKLKSVIIKRCHYGKSSSTGPANEPMGDEAPQTSADTVAGPSREEPTTSSRLVQEQTDACLKQEGEPLKCEPADNEMQGASTSGSSTESEPEQGWNRYPSVIATAPPPTCSNVSYNPLPSGSDGQHQLHQQWHQQQTIQYIEEQLQLPLTNSDDQQQQQQQQQQDEPAPLVGSGLLDVVDASNTGVGSDPENYDDHYQYFGYLRPEEPLSSEPTSPFSSISFPSATSFSPSPPISSQSLPLPVAGSPPQQLIERVPMLAMDSDSPLPSSVLGIDAIDGTTTIDEIMATTTTEEVASAAASSIAPQPSIADGLEGAGRSSTDPAAAGPCVLEPVAVSGAADGSASVPLQL